MSFESPILTITLAVIMVVVTIGGLSLFLKSEKPILKWGGLFAFGIGLLYFLFGYSFKGLIPPT